MSPTTAHAVLAAIRERLPGVGVKKAHKLLYYAQGHHLATFGEPLFQERISAWDMGPVVGQVWHDERHDEVPADLPELDEAALNTVGYVLSRYGSLSGNDLERLTHTEMPWQRADRRRHPGGSEQIDQEWIEEFFRDQPEDDEDVPVDARTAAALVDGAEVRRRAPSVPDDLVALRSRIDRLRGTGTRVG